MQLVHNKDQTDSERVIETLENSLMYASTHRVSDIAVVIMSPNGKVMIDCAAGPTRLTALLGGVELAKQSMIDQIYG